MQFSLQLPPANVPAPCAIHAARPQCLGCKAARRCRVAPPPAASTQDDPADESSQLQDNLVSMLRLEIGKKEVENYVEESADKLKQVADEAKAEFDKQAKLSNMRSEVAFDSAMADINRIADEFEEELRRSREQSAALEAEQEAWEDDVAVSRSQGQFFQSLYQKDRKRPVGESTEQLKERAAKVVQPAQAEVSSPLRGNLYLVLAFLLAADVGADLSSAEPSLGPDVLYTALAALAVWLSFNEKKSSL